MKQVYFRHKSLGNIEKSLDWFKILISILPSDPAILAKIGKIYEDQGDKVEALKYYLEVF
jgi:intraflagellar transport protein 88